SFSPAVLDWCREEWLHPRSDPARVALASIRPAPQASRVPHDREGLPARSSPLDPAHPPGRVGPVPAAPPSNSHAVSPGKAAVPLPEPVLGAPPASVRPSSGRTPMLVSPDDAAATDQRAPTDAASVQAFSVANASDELPERGTCTETDF